ncbi:helix-turn-helix domain-containing protein [Spirosoma endophyticum]|uniref:DNA binding domain-containing protein, excisionase family n=1 Tax=Spirosoma endophyticum TaxID=662367 RepID=A0A1I1F2G4_9BACT|nr:helix-turn-helix domain-containing protein [Spirosoma endophyticum]SFB93471.1 DNA binding domain-containing protein, excisionase family [Spirosoma endophyticum]
MPKHIQGTLFYTLPEAAIALHISVGKLKSYLDQSRLTSERIGRTVLIREEILSAYLAKRT